MFLNRFLQINFFLSAFFILSACSGGGSSDDEGTTRVDEEGYLFSVFEGDEGTQTLTVEYTSDFTGSVTYETYNVTAAQKSDFQAVSGDLVVENGVGNSFDIAIFSDVQIEGDEEFGFRIKNSNSETVFDGKIQIKNDDFPNITVNQPEATETDIGTARLRFEFKLDTPVVDDLQLNVVSLTQEQIDALDSSIYPLVAIPDVDFTAVDQQIVFNSGVTDISLIVDVLAENIIEDNEYVLLQVTNEDGLNLLDEDYAIGIIRSDETTELNGFDLTFVDEGQNLSSLEEGSTEEGETLSWEAVSIQFSVDNPENILEEQNLRLSLLDEDEYKALIGNSDVDYVQSSGDDADLCLNPSEFIPSDENLCQTYHDVTIEHEQSTVSFELQINKDLVRENNEAFFLVLENDQGVTFTTLSGVLVNDDREELYLSYSGLESPIKLSEFNSFVELDEPIESSSEENGEVTYTLELSLRTEISNTYALSYSVETYTVISPASSNEFLAVDDELLEFNATTTSNQIPITLYGDGRYDGDKHIVIEFSNDSGLDPVRIKIKDLNIPSVSIVERSGIEHKNDVEVNGESISYLPISEQTDSSVADDSGVDKEYNLSLDLAGAITAISGLEYIMTYSSLTFATGEERTDSECLDANLSDSQSRLKNATYDDQSEPLDFVFEIDGEFVESGQTVMIGSGNPDLDFTLVVKNDALIECEEIFKLEFSPVGVESDDPTEFGAIEYFVIDNKDGALISVSSNTVTEGSAVSNTETSIGITSNKIISSNFAFTNVTDHSGDLSQYECNSDDVQFAGSLSLSDAQSTSHSVEIAADSIVEPNETCLFNVSTSGNRFPIEIEHDAGAGSFAELLITNDDLLNITFVNTTESDNTTLIEPINSAASQIGIAQVQWDKEVALNTPAISLGITSASCTSTEVADCLESDDLLPLDLDTTPVDVSLTAGSVLNTDVPIYVVGDEVVENTEILTFDVSIAEGAGFIESVGVFDLEILNDSSDKLTYSLSELLPSYAVTNNGEAGSRTFELSTGAKTVESTVPEITLSLAALKSASSTTTPVRKSSGSDSDFEYLLRFEGSEVYGDEVIIKPTAASLAANSTFELVLELTDDDVVELPEEIDVTLSTAVNTSANAFSGSFTHSFGIDDKLQVWLDVVTDFELEDEADATYTYTVNWDGDVESTVPALIVNLSTSGNATEVGTNPDYSLTKPGSMSGELLTVKQAAESLTGTGSFNYALTIIEDNLVELDEVLDTTLGDSTDANSLLYIEFIDIEDSNAVVGSNTLSHTIQNEDFPAFAITQTTGNTSSDEEDTEVNVYEITWEKPFGENIGDIVLDLSFLDGAAAIGEDFTLTSTDTAALEITDVTHYDAGLDEDLSYSRLTIKKDVDSVLAETNSVSFNINVLDDTLVEADENALASFFVYPTQPSYITYSVNDSLAHTIFSAEGVTISLTRFSGDATSYENDEHEAIFELSWDQLIAQGIGDIPVIVNFTGDVDSDDYSLNVASGYGGGLSIDSSTNTFTIKKNSNSDLPAGSVRFTVIIDDDNVVEPEESFSMVLEEDVDTPSFIGVDTPTAITHTILINGSSDKTELALEPRASYPSSRGENNTQSFEYELNWDRAVSSNTPALFVDIPFEDSASYDDVSVSVNSGDLSNLTIISGMDASVPTPFEGIRLFFKDAGQSLSTNDDVRFTITVVNDDIVEINEELSGGLTVTNTVTDPNTLMDYVTFGSNTELTTHTIVNDDEITLSLVEDSGNAAKSGNTENTATTLTYTLGWDKTVASNVPALIVDLPLDGNASLADFSIAEGTGLSVSGDAYTFKTLGTALAAGGTVTFDYTIVDDNEVEMAETISAEMELDTTTYSYLSNYVQLSGSSNSLSHEINPDGDSTELSLTKVVGTLDAANEEDEVTVTYQLGWTNPVASDVPALAVDINLSDISTTATEDADFTVNTLPSGLTRSGDIFTFKALNTALAANGSHSISFTVTDDAIVETPESITASLSASGSLSDYATISGTANSISHTINNTDQTELSLALASGGATSGEASETTVTYNLVSSLAVASDVPDLNITLALSGTATSGVDYTFTDLTTKALSTPISAGAVIDTFKIDIDEDSTVEADETFIATLGLGTGADTYAQLGGSNNVVTHTINNDDYIDITINTTASEEGDAVQYTVGAYTSSGLTGTIAQTITLADNSPFFATGATSDITSVSNLSYAIVSNQASATTAATLVAIEDDSIIEEDETFTLSLANLFTHSDYVKVNGNDLAADTALSITITDNDKLDVKLSRFHEEDDGAADLAYSMQLCYPTDPVIQGATSIGFTSGISTESTTGEDIVKINWYNGSDIASSVSAPSFNTASSFTFDGSNYCQSAVVFTTNHDTDTESSEWLILDLDTTDSRVSSTNLGGVDILITDNDFPLLTQTGADKCIEASGNLGTSCASSNSKQDYNRAEISDHPEQHFTVISNGVNMYDVNAMESGEPSRLLPTSGGVDFDGENGYCLLDSYSNSIWLVGGFYVDSDLTLNSNERVPFYSSTASDKTALTLQTDAQTADSLDWCGVTSNATEQWQLPTVQELITILNIEHLRGAEELSSDTGVALTGYFQNHFNDSDVLAADDPNQSALQTNCELADPNSCGTSTDASTISSYYWSNEYCLSDAAIEAAETARESREAATSARQYADGLAVDDPDKAQANEDASTAEGLANDHEDAAQTAINDQTHVWAVDFASGQLSCRAKTDTAHVRLVYRPI